LWQWFFGFARVAKLFYSLSFIGKVSSLSL